MADILNQLLNEEVAAAPSGRSTAVAIAHDNGERISAYKWSEVTGIGTKFSNPVSGIGHAGFDCVFSPDKSIIIVSHNQGLAAFNFSDVTGFGSRYTDATSNQSGGGFACDFHPNQDAVAVVFKSSPGIAVVPWSNATGFGTQYSNPTTLPVVLFWDKAYDVKFSPAGDAIAISSDASPRIFVYQWSSVTGFGAKFSDPAVLPVTGVFSLDFSPAGDAIACTDALSPYIHAWQWSGTTGFGTKYSDPTSIIGGYVWDIKFSHSGNAIALSNTPTPLVYEWSSVTGFGTLHAPASIISPGYANGSNGNGVAWSATDESIIITHEAGWLFTIYKWLNPGFGTKWGPPTFGPTGAFNASQPGYGADFN